MDLLDIHLDFMKSAANIAKFLLPLRRQSPMMVGIGTPNLRIVGSSALKPGVNPLKILNKERGEGFILPQFSSARKSVPSQGLYSPEPNMAFVSGTGPLAWSVRRHELGHLALANAIRTGKISNLPISWQIVARSRSIPLIKYFSPSLEEGLARSIQGAGAMSRYGGKAGLDWFRKPLPEEYAKLFTFPERIAHKAISYGVRAAPYARDIGIVGLGAAPMAGTAYFWPRQPTQQIQPSGLSVRPTDEVDTETESEIE